MDMRSQACRSSVPQTPWQPPVTRSAILVLRRSHAEYVVVQAPRRSVESIAQGVGLRQIPFRVQVVRDMHQLMDHDLGKQLPVGPVRRRCASFDGGLVHGDRVYPIGTIRLPEPETTCMALSAFERTVFEGYVGVPYGVEELPSSLPIGYAVLDPSRIRVFTRYGWSLVAVCAAAAAAPVSPAIAELRTVLRTRDNGSRVGTGHHSRHPNWTHADRMKRVLPTKLLQSRAWICSGHNNLLGFMGCGRDCLDLRRCEKCGHEEGDRDEAPCRGRNARRRCTARWWCGRRATCPPPARRSPPAPAAATAAGRRCGTPTGPAPRWTTPPGAPRSGSRRRRGRHRGGTGSALR